MSGQEPVIVTEQLQKSYGEVEALKRVSLTVNRGEIFGLLGQNGAGKSTLIKILLGIVRKTEGSATLLGEPAGRSDVRRRVGYLPEDHQFPQYHTGASLLHFYGQLYGMSRDDRRRKIPEVLETVGIRKRMDSKLRTYSKGMKQRLGIAQAIFHDPDVIFLDEPTDGVDPVGRKELRELFEKLRDQGRTLFVNSHLLQEVELVCTRVAILQRGEIVRLGTVADLTRQEGRFVIGLAPGQELPADEVIRLGYRLEKAGAFWEVVVNDPTDIDRVLELVSARGLKLRHLVEKKQSLEDVFVRETDQNAPGTDERSRKQRGGR
ncbi:ABC transporter ATP-binding protein [Limnoglobus roseus]|uniref:ABC transporter ATP-binding protein n=1 Tax=Limnoglobus roseus TaxID=2598579 RepID=A0A5C1AIP6_9BACT|nr:ABC transporter ATP-binding protein [Limnoglobus roseus]QEL18027.1 ABC transporter ATP-binding protein [Limnoglobus roseus]